MFCDSSLFGFSSLLSVFSSIADMFFGLVGCWGIGLAGTARGRRARHAVPLRVGMLVGVVILADDDGCADMFG